MKRTKNNNPDKTPKSKPRMFSFEQTRLEKGTAKELKNKDLGK